MAALLIGERVVAARHEEMAKGQAERLMPMLEEVLAEAGLDWPAIDAIGVGVGPGNFTGIRIGVSAARGLALGLGIPALGVNRFEALAEGTEGAVISTLDAPRGEVYAQVLGGPAGAAQVGDPATIELALAPGAAPACIGPGAAVLARRFGGEVAQPRFSLAEAIARIAARRRTSGAEGRPSPLYVRPADAAPASDPPPVILP